MIPWIAAFVIVLCAAEAFAQGPRIDVGGGYALVSASPSSSHAWYVDASMRIARSLALVAEVDRSGDHSFFDEIAVVRPLPGGGPASARYRVSQATTRRTVVAGLRGHLQTAPRVAVFAQGLAGVARLSTAATVSPGTGVFADNLRRMYTTSTDLFAVEGGGGLSVAVISRLSLRAGLDYRALIGDYYRREFGSLRRVNGHLGEFRFAAGLALRVMGPP